MTRIKKIKTPSKKNWMDDLKNAIDATINGFIYGMEANTNSIKSKLKGNMEYLKKDTKGVENSNKKFYK